MKNKSKNIMIMFIIGLLFVMTTGYAIYQNNLNVNGVARIDYKNWNIHISNIETVESDAGYDVIAPTYTNTTAKFNSKITKVGGYIKYKVTIKNDGVIDGVLGAINITDTDNSLISYEVIGMEVDDELRAHETKELYVKAIYDTTKVDTATNSKSNVSVNLTFVQLEGYTPQKPTSEYAASFLRKKATTSGDGLYADYYEDGRYIYKGANPDNYISFNNEVWRILSVESDGSIKIVKENMIEQIVWDEENNRLTENNSYCSSSSIGGYGCNAWASTSNLIGTPDNFTLYFPSGNKDADTETYSGTVTQDSSLNTYLNTTYLASLDQTHVISHDWAVGSPGNYTDTEDLSLDIEQEKYYMWNGVVGLINATEYMRATTADTCTSLSLASENGTNCGTNNWLNKNEAIFYWTINPHVDSDQNYVFVVTSGFLTFYVTAGTIDFNEGIEYVGAVYPTVYLTPDITLTGTGENSEENIYRIVNS